MYLSSLGVVSATSTGLMAGAPWLAVSVTGTLVGRTADKLIQAGMQRMAVRRLMHAVSRLLYTHACTHLCCTHAQYGSALEYHPCASPLFVYGCTVVSSCASASLVYGGAIS